MATKTVRSVSELPRTIAERVDASRLPVPLGELYRGPPVCVSLGAFHDTLRELNAAGMVRLSP